MTFKKPQQKLLEQFPGISNLAFIDKGSFGSVYKGDYKDKKGVAIKLSDIDNMSQRDPEIMKIYEKYF